MSTPRVQGARISPGLLQATRAALILARSEACTWGSGQAGHSALAAHRVRVGGMQCDLKCSLPGTLTLTGAAPHHFGIGFSDVPSQQMAFCPLGAPRFSLLFTQRVHLTVEKREIGEKTHGVTHTHADQTRRPKLRPPGVEPGSPAWKAGMITATLRSRNS